jgi:hypothetical protein
MVIEQLQARLTWKSEVDDVKVTTIHGLKVSKPQNTPIEFKRFLDIDAVDGDVIYISYFQGMTPMKEKSSPCPVYGLPARFN